MAKNDPKLVEEIRNTAADSDITKDVNKEEWIYYVTTVHIPVWLAKYLEKIKQKRGHPSRSSVFETVMIKDIIREDLRDKRNKMLKHLESRGSITEREKEELWL